MGRRWSVTGQTANRWACPHDRVNARRWWPNKVAAPARRIAPLRVTLPGRRARRSPETMTSLLSAEGAGGDKAREFAVLAEPRRETPLRTPLCSHREKRPEI